MKNLIFSVIGLILFSSSVLAASDGRGFFIGTEVQLVTTDDKVNDENLTSSGVGLNLGYYFNQYVGLEASYAISDDLINDDSFEHYDFSLLGRLPLTDSFSVIIGGGTAIYQDSALAKGQIGLSYQVTDNFYWDAGYTFYGKSNGWEDHVESFDVGFTYRFGQNVKSDLQEVAIVQSPVQPIEKQKPVPQPKPVVKKEPVCQTQLVTESYRVKKGEWLRKIADDHDMTWSYFQKVNVDFMRNTPNINIIQPGDVLKINLTKEVCK